MSLRTGNLKFELYVHQTESRENPLTHTMASKTCTVCKESFLSEEGLADWMCDMCFKHTFDHHRNCNETRHMCCCHRVQSYDDEYRRSVLESALKLAMLNGSWSNLALTHENCLKSESTLRTVWKFDYELLVETVIKRGTVTYCLRDVVNTPEFRESLAVELALPDHIAVTVSPLERDYKVGSEGAVVRNDAYIWVAMDRIEQTCDCGAPVKNGRMTCICWADRDDLARMHRDLGCRR